jgi:hypothetical protein
MSLQLLQDLRDSTPFTPAYAFDWLQRQAQWQRAWARLLRREQRLQTLNLSRQQIRYNSQRKLGIRSVPLEQIVGSIGRSQDFDRAFRPLKHHLRQRWSDIAVALCKGVVLPAVELVKVQEAYYVLDGHHRISVARFCGKVAIDANVIEWQGGM